MGNNNAIGDKIRKLWMRCALRGAHHSNDKKKISRIYLFKNPWRLDTPAEHYRYSETNRIIEEQIGPVKTLLEIGSAEGHQSLYLQQLCNHLLGVDVSARAVRRAKKRCPRAEFIVGDIFIKELESGPPFDLVTACEVLYYINNIPNYLERIRSLGNRYLITYYSGQMQNMDPFVLKMPGIFTEIIKYNDMSWRIVLGDTK